MVWSLPLQADSGGPTPIVCIVPRYHLRVRDTPFVWNLTHVGERVLCRLEQAGFGSLERLQQCSLSEIIERLLHQSSLSARDHGVWARSSHARSAVQAVLRHARARLAADGTHVLPNSINEH